MFSKPSETFLRNWVFPGSNSRHLGRGSHFSILTLWIFWKVREKLLVINKYSVGTDNSQTMNNTLNKIKKNARNLFFYIER